MPAQEAQRTSPFKTYLPNLTAFKKSSRCWITGFLFKDLPKKQCAAQAMLHCRPSQEAQRKSPFKTYLPNLAPFKNSSRRWTTGCVFKDLSKEMCGPTYAGPRKKPDEKVRSNVHRKSDGHQKLQPTLDHRIYPQWFI